MSKVRYTQICHSLTLESLALPILMNASAAYLNKTVLPLHVDMKEEKLQGDKKKQPHNFMSVCQHYLLSIQ